eukprot:Phypoly_transcript_17873.p1 GENE.Phypoly_transcript_17873~~Phypoly_transcript_17873.p1  ORF type:complete len:231 (+),score=53.17 Phypoly_transcript_17873:95-787(+)
MDEEKAMEIEALMAIYMDDFKMLGEDQFEISLTPTENEDNKIVVVLDVKLPPAYPQEIPALSLKAVKGVNAHELFDLEKSLREQAKDNIGTAMIFTLAQVVKEWLDELVSKRAAEDAAPPVETEEQRKKREQDAHEQRIAGTPITAETFNAWKVKFDAEMRELKKVAVDTEKLKKPTGRQLFEIDISLVMSDTTQAEEGDTVDVSALAKENVVVNWELFDDVPDDELGDE